MFTVINLYRIIQAMSVKTGFTVRILSIIFGTKRLSGFTIHLFFHLHHSIYMVYQRILVLSLLSLYSL